MPSGSVIVQSPPDLGVRPVGPVAQRRVQRAAELGLVGTIAAPRHDRFFQVPQDQVAERALPVFLADIRHVAATVDDTGPAGEILGIGEQSAPLCLQQIDDAQILAPLLEPSAPALQAADRSTGS
jgi:hypothetical protein